MYPSFPQTPDVAKVPACLVSTVLGSNLGPCAPTHIYFGGSSLQLSSILDHLVTHTHTHTLPYPQIDRQFHTAFLKVSVFYLALVQTRVREQALSVG